MGATKSTIEANHMLCPSKDSTADSHTLAFDDKNECID